MNRGDVISTIQESLGSRTDMRVEILRRMDLVQQTQLERGDTLPWFLLSDEATISTVNGTETVDVTSNMIREYEEGALWYYDASADEPWTPLVKGFNQVLRANLGYAYDTTGKPVAYALIGDKYHLRPVPDATYTLYERVYVPATLPSLLTDDTSEEKWLKFAPDYMIAWVIFQMSKRLQMRQNRIDSFREDVALATKRYERDVEARKNANFRYVMGD